MGVDWSPSMLGAAAIATESPDGLVFRLPRPNLRRPEPPDQTGPAANRRVNACIAKPPHVTQVAAKITVLGVVPRLQ